MAGSSEEESLIEEGYGLGLLEIQNYSKKKTPTFTKVVEAGGYHWVAGFHPEGSHPDSTIDNIDFSFTLLEEGKTKTRGFKNVLVHLTFALVHKDRPKFCASAIYRFSSKNLQRLARLEKKRLEGFFDDDILTIEAHAQIIGERKDPPFRCFASSYRRELLRVCLRHIEKRCVEFVGDCMVQYEEQTNNKTSWPSFEENAISCVKREIILKQLALKYSVKKVEEEVYELVFMECLYCGLKDTKVKKGVLEQKGDLFVLRKEEGGLFKTLKRIAKESLPQDGSREGEFNEFSNEVDERLIQLGRWTFERFVLTQMFREVVSFKNAKDFGVPVGASLQNLNRNTKKKKQKNKQVNPLGKGHGGNDGDEVLEQKLERVVALTPEHENMTKLNMMMRVSNKVLGQGSTSTVFEGEFSYFPAAIKRMHWKKVNEIPHEVENLRKCGYHPNLIVCHGCALDVENSFLYIAFERCTCTLQELITGDGDIGFERKLLWENTNYLNDLIGGIIDGVDHLHSWNLFHRDLTPENILIKISTSKDGCCKLIPKISDMGLMKDLDAVEKVLPLDLDEEKKLESSPDFALHYMYRKRKIPEQDKKQELTKKTDIYCLGILIAYILSHGEIDKASDQYSDFETFVNFFFKHDHPEAMRFLLLLAQDVPNLRPDIKQIKKDPFLWSPIRKIDFLEAVFGFVKDKDAETQTTTASDEVEDLFKPYFGNVETWKEKLNNTFQNDVSVVTSTHSPYNGRKMMDLLRYIRNKKHHPGSVFMTSVGVAEYFCTTFPHMFSVVYKHAQKLYKNEDFFCMF